MKGSVVVLWSGNSGAHGVGMCGRVDVTSLCACARVRACVCVFVCGLGDSVVIL